MAWFHNNDRSRLWFEEHGHGQALVLLHGWCMSSRIWQMQVEGLSSLFRVIIVDLPGHGKSISVRHTCDLDFFAAEVSALIDHLDLVDAVLAGWSLGAQVALQSVHLVRQRLKGLVLIGATPCFTATETFPYGLTRSEADGMALKVRRNIERALDGFKSHLFVQDELDQKRASGVIQVLKETPAPGLQVALESLHSLAEADLRPLLPEIDLPTLVLNGELDPICLPEASSYIARAIAMSSHHVFKKCGHAPFLSQPETFNGLIADFIRRSCASGDQ